MVHNYDTIMFLKKKMYIGQTITRKPFHIPSLTSQRPTMLLRLSDHSDWMMPPDESRY